MNPAPKGRHSFEIAIDELILDGFSPAERYVIAEALERELTNLLTEHDFAPGETRGTDIDRLNAGQVHLRPQVTPDAVGEKVAGAVFNSIQASSKHD